MVAMAPPDFAKFLWANLSLLPGRASAGAGSKASIVTLSVVVLVLGIGLWSLGYSLLRTSRELHLLSSMKTLHLATQQLEIDGRDKKDPSLGWPGDTGGSFTNWTGQLLRDGLYTAQDLRRELSAPGIVIPPGEEPNATNTAMHLYAVGTNSPSTAVFLTSANFTNTPSGGVLDRHARPFGGHAFLVWHKGGDGQVLTPEHAGDTNVVGAFVPLCR